MREVISNTSPLQYLHQLNLLDLLPSLYRQIIVPQSVVEELAVGRQRGVNLPTPELLPWVNVRSSRERNLLPLVTALGPGEREALALGVEIPESLLILDDALARKHAELLHLTITGTLGILLKAKATGHIPEVLPVLNKLDALNFRVHPSTRESVLKLAGE
ncbi:MAG TPA: DUF3368 domain-containing protein [Planctomycetota bacterium]|nr:DUF3368 domain-containing protein [Planctomycetota bacterium]